MIGIGEVREIKEFKVTRTIDCTDRTDRVILKVVDKKSGEDGLFVATRSQGEIPGSGRFYALD